MINVPNTKLFGQMCLDNFIYDPIEGELESLVAFFTRGDLDTHRQVLDRWKAVVTSSDYFEINTVNNPLHEHKMMCNLANTAWLISQNPFLKSKLVDLDERELAAKLDFECLTASCFPDHLDNLERIDPYKGIKLFFENYSLQTCHQILYEWLNLALSPNSQADSESATLKFYDSFLKLIECCWLIQSREVGNRPSNQPNCKVEDQAECLENIPENLMHSFRQFLATVPADRLNRGLRKMLIDYLQYNINGLPVDFEELLADLYWLTELLDEIQGKQVDEKFR